MTNAIFIFSLFKLLSDLMICGFHTSYMYTHCCECMNEFQDSSTELQMCLRLTLLLYFLMKALRVCTFSALT